MGEGFGCIYQVNKGGKLIVAKSEKKIEKKKLDTESFIKEYTEMVTSLKLKK